MNICSMEEIKMRKYISQININIVEDVDLFAWCWIDGEYYVCKSKIHDFYDHIQKLIKYFSSGDNL